MNLVASIFGTLVIAAAIYLLLLFISQWLVLLFLQARYSGPDGMNEFLSRYPRSKRLNFEDAASLSLADIQKHDAYGWGMMGMGMMIIYNYGQSGFSNEHIWFSVLVSFLAPAMQGFLRASSHFAAKCFSKLGISSITEIEKPANG